MAGFERRSSVVRSDHTTNCATTAALGSLDCPFCINLTITVLVKGA